MHVVLSHCREATHSHQEGGFAIVLREALHNVLRVADGGIMGIEMGRAVAIE